MLIKNENPNICGTGGEMFFWVYVPGGQRCGRSIPVGSVPARVQLWWSFSANTRSWPNIGLTLGQRRRRWAALSQHCGSTSRVLLGCNKVLKNVTNHVIMPQVLDYSKAKSLKLWRKIDDSFYNHRYFIPACYTIRINKTVFTLIQDL